MRRDKSRITYLYNNITSATYIDIFDVDVSYINDPIFIAVNGSGLSYDPDSRPHDMYISQIDFLV